MAQLLNSSLLVLPPGLPDKEPRRRLVVADHPPVGPAESGAAVRDKAKPDTAGRAVPLLKDNPWYLFNFFCCFQIFYLEGAEVCDLEVLLDDLDRLFAVQHWQPERVEKNEVPKSEFPFSM